ncbi:MAG TPA: hypothetical protein VE288_07785 [Rubrobacteraceae bacterium]|nr:hypothetical protein [Rubrobacteraceae bacterium]
MKTRLLCVFGAALVAMLMLVPSAIAQEAVAEQTTEATTMAPLPPTGGSAIGGPALVLPAAAALLLGAGVLTYAVVRRRH